ncbi:MAG: twitching motility protein PilT [Lachnospiraceae bacterium]|nr:twitching motility protein PilT [Lachnospiraceae bacterium]
MVQLIVGNKGKGKTKHLLEKVNTQVQESSGNIVYLDKSAKHMYELNNKVRLIDLSQYDLATSDEFIGFLYGVISQDHDLEQMYLDNFLNLARIEDQNDQIEAVIGKLDKMSEKFNVDFILSVGCNESDLAEGLKSKIIVSL